MVQNRNIFQVIGLILGPNCNPFSGKILYPISHLFLMISLQYVTILPNTQIFSALRSTYISPCILIFFFIQFLILFLKTEIFSALRSTYIYRYDTNISLKLCETFHTPKVAMETSFKRDTRLSRLGLENIL